MRTPSKRCKGVCLGVRCVCVYMCVYTTSIQVSTYGKAIKNPPRYNSIRHFEVSDQKGVVGARLYNHQMFP